MLVRMPRRLRVERFSKIEQASPVRRGCRGRSGMGRAVAGETKVDPKTGRRADAKTLMSPRRKQSC